MKPTKPCRSGTRDGRGEQLIMLQVHHEIVYTKGYDYTYLLWCLRGLPFLVTWKRFFIPWSIIDASPSVKKDYKKYV